MLWKSLVEHRELETSTALTPFEVEIIKIRNDDLESAIELCEELRRALLDTYKTLYISPRETASIIQEALRKAEGHRKAD